ncbi:MAG: hypothetical protein M3Y34_01625 [Actinomycetota bacterium]|nr:hypothetical protein [Actinomycetota bacterium]
MANHLEQTWVAYAFDEAAAESELQERCRRVRAHTQQLFAEEILEEGALGPCLGLALWRRPDPRLRAALFASDERLAVAVTSPITGAGSLGAADSSLQAVGAALVGDPAGATRLNPPFVIGIATAARDRLVIANDVIGTARLFELRTGAGRIWSNRIGALVAFAGHRPPLDARAWQGLAATGWFLGETTSLEGVRQLRSATTVVAERRGERTVIDERRDPDALAALVRPRRIRLRRSARAAADAARTLAQDVDRSWDCKVRVDLSGGRDSRVSAAAALAVGVDAEFRTSDLEYGEVDVVRELMARAPANPEHSVKQAESEPDDALAGRLRGLHLVHDGVRNPQSLLRSSMPLPHGPLEAPVLSGHGGELGHGFYYSSAAEIRKLRRGGPETLLERLDKAARKKHGAAREEAYATYLDEARTTLAEGRELGLEGPALLDHYYLAQRLANRSGLTTRNERWSACSTPEFIRACFDLTPKQRLASRMHRLVISELVPAWADAPWFEAHPDTSVTKRTRIWDKPGHREELGQIIESDESWHDLFAVAEVKAAWAEARGGEIHPHWESVFTRIVWRATFERHLSVLDRAAGTGLPRTS